MPGRKGQKRAASSVSAPSGARAKKRKLNSGAASGSSKLAYAASSGVRTKFNVVSTQNGGSSCLRVHVCDQLSGLDGPITAGNYPIMIGDYIPFTLAEDSPALASLGCILPKLQGFAKISSRYQVREARLHFQSTAPASRDGVVGMALVPGACGAVAAVTELASFDHSAVGPLWQSMSTSRWVNKEQRFYHTQASTSQELVPFTVVRLSQAGNPVTGYAPGPVGLYWLELTVDFIDLRPMSQLGATFVTGSAKTLTGGLTNAQNTASWTKNRAMDGLWDWGVNKIGSALSSGVPYTLPSASTVGVDALQTIEWFGDFILGAAAVESKSEMPLLSWSREEEEIEVKRREEFPGPWVQPPRTRKVCAFRSVAEAQAARASGFDPERVIRSLPNAAGDASVFLRFQPRGNIDASILASWVISGGTGAQEVKLQHSFAVGDIPGDLFCQIVPTGVESRILDAASSQDLTSVNAITSVAP